MRENLQPGFLLKVRKGQLSSTLVPLNMVKLSCELSCTKLLLIHSFLCSLRDCLSSQLQASYKHSAFTTLRWRWIGEKTIDRTLYVIRDSYSLQTSWYELPMQSPWISKLEEWDSYFAELNLWSITLAAPSCSKFQANCLLLSILIRLLCPVSSPWIHNPQHLIFIFFSLCV